MAVAQKAAMHQLERQKYSIEADVKTLDLENKGLNNQMRSVNEEIIIRDEVLDTIGERLKSLQSELLSRDAGIVQLSTSLQTALDDSGQSLISFDFGKLDSDEEEEEGINWEMYDKVKHFAYAKDVKHLEEATGEFVIVVRYEKKKVHKSEGEKARAAAQAKKRMLAGKPPVEEMDQERVSIRLTIYPDETFRVIRPVVAGQFALPLDAVQFQDQRNEPIDLDRAIDAELQAWLDNQNTTGQEQIWVVLRDTSGMVGQSKQKGKGKGTTVATVNKTAGGAGSKTPLAEGQATAPPGGDTGPPVPSIAVEGSPPPGDTALSPPSDPTTGGGALSTLPPAPKPPAIETGGGDDSTTASGVSPPDGTVPGDVLLLDAPPLAVTPIEGGEGGEAAGEAAGEVSEKDSKKKKKADKKAAAAAEKAAKAAEKAKAAKKEVPDVSLFRLSPPPLLSTVYLEVSEFRHHGLYCTAKPGGVLVDAVDSVSDAEASGLKPGYVILSIDAKPCGSVGGKPGMTDLQFLAIIDVPEGKGKKTLSFEVTSALTALQLVDPDLAISYEKAQVKRDAAANVDAAKADKKRMKEEAKQKAKEDKQRARDIDMYGEGYSAGKGGGPIRLDLSHGAAVDRRNNIVYAILYISYMACYTYTLFERRSIIKCNAISTSLGDTLLRSPFDDPHLGYLDIATLDEYWLWIESILTPALHPYTSEAAPHTAYTVGEATNNRLVGGIRFSQWRVHDEKSCKIEPKLDKFGEGGVSSKCYSDYSISSSSWDYYWKGATPTTEGATLTSTATDEEKQAVCGNGAVDSTSCCVNSVTSGLSVPPDCEPGFTWIEQWPTQNFPASGKKATYLSSAFLRDFAVTGDPLADRVSFSEGLTRLRQGGWIDLQSRAIQIKFVTYNSNYDYLSITSIMMEQDAGGGLHPSASFTPFDAAFFYDFARGSWDVSSEGREGDVGRFRVARVTLEGYVALYSIAMILDLGRRAVSYNKFFFQHTFNSIYLLLCLSIMLSYSLRIAFSLHPKRLLAIAGIGRGHYTDMMDLASAYDFVYLAEAFTCFLAFLYGFDFLRFHHGIGLIWKTLNTAAAAMASYLFIVMIIMFGFIYWGKVTYGPYLRAFATDASAISTLSRLLLGDFDYDAMSVANPLVTPAFFASFMLLVILVLFNIFLAILNDAYTLSKEVQDEEKKEISDRASRGLVPPPSGLVRYVKAVFRQDTLLNKEVRDRRNAFNLGKDCWLLGEGMTPAMMKAKRIKFIDDRRRTRATLSEFARQVAWGKNQIGRFNTDVVSRSARDFRDEMKRRDDDSDSDAEYDDFEAVDHTKLVMTNFEKLKRQDQYVDDPKAVVNKPSEVDI